MAAISNVALGVHYAPHSTAVMRLVCSLLLLATDAVGLGRARLRVVAPDHEEVADQATDTAANEAALAGEAAIKSAHQTKDTARLVDSESKKMSKHLHGKAQAMLPDSLSSDDGTTNYLIASLPELRVINYVRLPDLVWRPLIVSGIANPKAMVVDEDRARLYVADNAVAKIFWYQLLALPDKTLISDGRQHVAAQMVAVRNMALDLEGNLWFSAASTPVPPVPSIDGIWKQPLIVIDQSSLTGVPVDPLPTWTKPNTGSTVSPLALDAFNIFYGNDMDGKKKGSIVKASQSVPLANPSSGLSALGDNADQTLTVAVTPTVLFYGAEGAIYGIPKTKIGASCGADGAQCQTVTDLVKKPTAMVWDGDGTVYVADNGGGAIYSFASGSVSPHALDKIIDASHIWGMGVFTVVRDQDSSARRSTSTILMSAFFACTLLAIFQ